MLEHFFKKYEFEFALKVIKVARIIVDHILFRISILPYVFRFILFYFLTTNFEPGVYKNIRYGKKDRNYLDIYSSETENSPVVLYCHGGGWDSGNKVYYCLLGRTLRKKNVTTVNMNYTLYPNGSVEEMVHDVKTAVEWVKTNIHKYGGDPTKIYLLGHSAGAHLMAQYLCINSLSTLEERESFTEYKNYFSNWNTSNLDSSQIAGFIGLSGVYDMDNHLVYEKKRGVEWISRMTQTMSGIEKFKLHSPMRQIAKLKSAKLPKIYLRHGEYDGTVPYESSTLFYNELKKHSASDLFDFKVYPQMNHTDPIFNLMDDTYQHHSVLLEDILHIISGAAK